MLTTGAPDRSLATPVEVSTEDGLGTVHVHSCEWMPELPDGSVALTVTSPPYWNAIDYQRHQSEPSANYRLRPAQDYQAYLDFLTRCFGEVYRVHREGTFCAVVIGTVLLNRRHIPLPFHLVARMESLGWQFHQDIVWAKVTGGVKRARLTIQHPYPGYYYPNLMTEYILVFRKPGPRRIYAGRPVEEKQLNRVKIDSVFTHDVANNVWHIAPVPPKQFDHPCPFPEEIPHRLIRWFSYQDEGVLDPFCGIGTTLKVAAQLGRRWVGYEISEQYAARARARVSEPLVPRRQLVPRVERVPYGMVRRPAWPAPRQARLKRARQRTRR